MEPASKDQRPPGAISAIVARFQHGPLSPLLTVAALALGAAAIFMTPREEEPQIVVPMADIHVSYPGGSAEEVEKLVASQLERQLWQIDGVEHVYSVSRRDGAVVTVRFYVGEDRERSLVKLHNRITAHMDMAPAGVAGWVIRPIEIDDVPIVSITLSSEVYDDHVLRRIGEELRGRLDPLTDVSRTRLIGGRSLQVRVALDPERMAARSISALEVHRALSGADASLSAGSFDRANRQIDVVAGPFLTSVDDVAGLIIGVSEGRPLHLSDVADVRAGPEEAPHYTRIGFGPASGKSELHTRPAVTLAVAKKKGTNAVSVANSVIDRIESLRRDIVPSEIDLEITRNYGESADKKVNELLASLAFAMITVVGLLMFTLGWREGLIVALAVPISFSLALFVNYLTGYTINRVTLFALILTLGLVVDDPITNVDNIQRHILMGKLRPRFATLAAVSEVLPPVIMSTLTIIVSFVPLFFITGMMGPYMEPMAINVPLTVIFSTVAALTVVPWASYRLLRKRAPCNGKATSVNDCDSPDWLRRAYGRTLGPLLDSRGRRRGLFAIIVAMLIGSALLVVGRQVPMKLLPFDNKNELQLVIDMPEGTPLETTDAVVSDFEDYIHTIPEVRNFEAYVGTYSPIDFNGLVRHHYFRIGDNMADIRINLVDKDEREQQSHEIALRIRRDLEAIARAHNATLAIVESPPGPPVISTVTAELYGPADTTYAQLIEASALVIDRMRSEPGVVDIDRTVETARTRVQFTLDKEKAGLHGISTEAVVQTLRIALSGANPATVHARAERNPLNVHIRFPIAKRSGIAELGSISVKGGRGELVPLDELGNFTEVAEDAPIYHKNLERVVYVLAEMAGRAPAEAIIDMSAHFRDHPLPHGASIEWAGEGEWEITLRVFRDLGLAFMAAMLGIYILLVLQTSSFLMPLVIMSAIPLTAIGIIPGFWLLNLVSGAEVGGFATPVFFTATAMIGMIALGGIVVRNSIVLIEFIEGARKNGASLREAILLSGAVRMRPILLTAATTALGAFPITLDPIFSGLAWALIFGLISSTAFTLLVIPVMYSMIYGRQALTPPPRATATNAG